VKANVVEEKQSRPTTRVSSAPLRRKSAARFEGLKDFPGLNLRGPMTRAPPATADIAAGGTRFIGAPSAARMEAGTQAVRPKPLPGKTVPAGGHASRLHPVAGRLRGRHRMNFLAEERNCFVVYPE
jgi:hypothetical protein